MSTFLASNCWFSSNRAKVSKDEFVRILTEPKVALSFGPHEYFAIAVFSLTLIATLSAGSMVKGLFAGTLGIAVSTVGIAPVEAVRRRHGREGLQ